MPLYIMLLLSLFSWFQTSKGNQLYEKEQYPEALEAYREAQKKDPDSPAIHYNIGNAFYRQGKFKEAAQEYRQATDGAEPFNSQAYYNLGNSLFRDGQLPEAVEAYKRALRITPGDMDAKYNLEFVQRQLQEQEKQPPSSQDEQQDKDKQQDDSSQDSSESEQQNQDEPQPSQGPEENKQDGNQQQPEPGDMTREEAERLLNALNQNEQDIQKSLRKQAPVKQNTPKKDW